MHYRRTFSPFTRLQYWLTRADVWDRYLPILIGLATYVVVFMGSFVIGRTSFGIFMLGGAVAAVGGAVIFLRPSVGAYILVFFIFTNFSDILEVKFGVPDANKALVGLILVAILARRVVIDNKPIIFRAAEMSMLFYGLWMLFSLLISKDQTNLNIILIEWFKEFIILLTLVQIASTEEHVWKNTHWAALAGAAFLGTLSVIVVITKIPNDFYGFAKAPKHEITAGYDDVRITGPLDDPNFYAMVMLSMLPLGAYLMLNSPKWYTKAIAGFMTLMVLLTVLFTYSRGAFLALMIMAALIVWERRWSPYKVAAIGFVLVMLLMPVMPKGFTARLGTLGGILPSSGNANMQAESSFRGRTSELLVAIMMFEERPLSGVGKWNYAASYLQYSSRLGLDNRIENRQAHSLYFELLAEQGIMGFSIFMTMVGLAFKGLFDSVKKFREANRPDLIPRVYGCMFGVVGYLAASTFLHMDYERYFWLILGFCFATSAQAEMQVQLFRHNKRADVSEITPTPLITTA